MSQTCLLDEREVYTMAKKKDKKKDKDKKKKGGKKK
jgi:hypothetical protein